VDDRAEGIITELFARTLVLEEHARVLLAELDADAVGRIPRHERVRLIHAQAAAVSSLVRDLASATPDPLGSEIAAAERDAELLVTAARAARVE
jgi:hypothetical protein